MDSEIDKASIKKDPLKILKESRHKKKGRGVAKNKKSLLL